jgi:pimeloyl-ACP methyl ester carboxylesterase
MSTTVSATAPPAYTDWIANTLAELGLRDQVRDDDAPQLRTANNRPPLPTIQGAVKGRSYLPIVGGILRREALGSGRERRHIPTENRQAIDTMREAGLATGVQIDSHGRTLDGNFFSASGHNLKSANGQPDLTRPLVLLLSGSAGSAEDQGLDNARFYAGSGASVLSVNYDGYGNSSPGKPTEESLLQDAHSMLQYAVDLGYEPEDIVIHGYSMGGALGGKLKEAVEANSGRKMRGLVLDRPMLSMAHGVETQLDLGKTGQKIGQLSRLLLGTFSARSAIARSANTDTRTVVGTDEGSFADRADAFRQQLLNQNVGRAVTGARSDADHHDHKKAIDANRQNYLALIQQDRRGNAQNLAAGNGPSAFQETDYLITLIRGELKMVRAAAVSINDDAKNLTGQEGFQVFSTQMRQADSMMGRALDLKRSMPAGDFFKGWLAQTEQTIGLIKDAMVTLTNLDYAALGAGYASAVLLDTMQTDARDALDAFQAAGGQSAQNVALENAVLNARADLGKLRNVTVDATLDRDLNYAHTVIKARRDQELARMPPPPARAQRGAPQQNG